MSGLEIQNLTKSFAQGGGNGIIAVDDLSISIRDGEFLVLVGPSGCGKSTTLRCIAGLESVTEGKILLGDEDITKKRSRERDIAMVFQNYALYPHMTSRSNMGFGLKMGTDLPDDTIRAYRRDCGDDGNCRSLGEETRRTLGGPATACCARTRHRS